MGMFDTVLVKSSLIEHLISPELISFFDKSSCDNNDYYSFQTKDLENFLYTYYFEDDRKVYVRKYSLIDEEPFSEISFDPVTAYVEFYDIINTNTHQVWYTFKAHVVNGVIQSITVHCVKQYCLVQMKIEGEELDRKYKLRESTWEMRLFRFLQTVQYSKLMNLFSRNFYKFQQYLKESAEKKCNL